MDIVGTVVSALVAALVAYLITNRDLSDSIDSKSKWREKLFDVAATYELTCEHAQTVRAALRFLPTEEKVEEYSFAWFSNFMITHLDEYILNKEKQSDKKDLSESSSKTKVLGISLLETKEAREKQSKLLSDFDSEIVRLFAMFLLKYHYENRSTMGPKTYLFIKGKNRSKEYDSLVAECYYHYLLMIKRIGCK